MTYIITITVILLMTGSTLYSRNEAIIEAFRNLAGETKLNFALPKTKYFLERPLPGIVGDYSNRSVSMMTRKGLRGVFTELAMNCKTEQIAKIEAKWELSTAYIYDHLNRGQSPNYNQFRAALTGDKSFDKHFFVVVINEKGLELFDKEVKSYLLQHFRNINFQIEIRGYELVVNDKNLSASQRAEGGIAENAVYMLNFLSKLADLLEHKRIA